MEADELFESSATAVKNKEASARLYDRIQEEQSMILALVHTFYVITWRNKKIAFTIYRAASQSIESPIITLNGLGV